MTKTLCALLLLVSTTASAAIIVSHKTGARANVGDAVASQFQAYVDDLETNHGVRVLFMGGNRPGHCSPRHMHSCQRALDVCQLRRGRVDGRCGLPAPRELAAIASRHGLFEGGQWCNSDYGHAQVGVSAPACGGSRTARLDLGRSHVRHTKQLSARSHKRISPHHTEVAGADRLMLH
jgi:hypothetical protein